MYEKSRIFIIVVILFIILDIWAKVSNCEFILSEMYLHMVDGNFLEFAPVVVDWRSGVIKKKYQTVLKMMQNGVKL